MPEGYMNATLTSTCKQCGLKYRRTVISAEDYSKLVLDLDMPLCYACDAQECAEYEGEQWEYESRRREQGYAPVSFSYESIMENDTVEHALYMSDSDCWKRPSIDQCSGCVLCNTGDGRMVCGHTGEIFHMAEDATALGG
jgi:hypothetical protein